MTETTRQVIFVVSVSVLLLSVMMLSLIANVTKHAPRVLRAFTAIFGLLFNVICANALITDPRHGVSVEAALMAIIAADVVALWAIRLAERRPVTINI